MTVPNVAPYCELCNNAGLTVKHVLLHCHAVDVQRHNAIRKCKENQNVNMCDLLGNDSMVADVLTFAKTINMYDNV
jgi:uncharacterized radical SAM superfamily protein